MSHGSRQFNEQLGPECVYTPSDGAAARTAGPMTLRVKDWGSLYENHRSREIKKLEFVLVPNRMDTDGYTQLLDHPNGAAHLGAWVAILQIASRCKERGVLANGDGRPHDARSLSRISRIPAIIFEEAIIRLVEEVQWLERVEGAAPDSRAMPPDSRAFARESATPTRVRVTVPFPSVPVRVPGKEGVGENPDLPHDPPVAASENTAGVVEELQQIYRAGGLPIPEKHQQLVLQYLIDMSPGKQERLTNYVKWAFSTGRWPSPAKTKALLQVIRDGDWDVELTVRTMPDAAQSRPPSKAQEAQDIATAMVLAKYGETA
jgi:hypothetical protein